MLALGSDVSKVGEGWARLGRNQSGLVQNGSWCAASRSASTVTFRDICLVLSSCCWPGVELISLRPVFFDNPFRSSFWLEISKFAGRSFGFNIVCKRRLACRFGLSGRKSRYTQFGHGCVRGRTIQN